MLRQRENPDSFKAGALSISVHVVLLGALLISFNWKTTHPVSVANVELWDSLPTAVQKTSPIPEPVEQPVVQPKPVVKEIVKPEPVIEPEPKARVDIVIKKTPVEKPVKKENPKEVKKPDALAELQKKLMQDELQKPQKQPSDDALKKLQQESLREDKAEGDQKNLAVKAAANAGVIGEFTNKIKAKIRGNVNKTLCGDGNPELKFEIGLLPGGGLSGNPKLVKSSGNAACDDAVGRAIMASEPLPVPTDTSLFSQFRNLKLTFRPND
ncbi:MAG: cell envelope integrity protein TolA [Methylotenera sp.]|nr:cell envelope integrity protein TolA [Methylotenera sp.]MDD4925095.1 cell envelope integrity protein TolA [Methylotenera sp.]NOS95705.1 cell envelope integrity protein TolA [Methylotenera sp.]